MQSKDKSPIIVCGGCNKPIEECGDCDGGVRCSCGGKVNAFNSLMEWGSVVEYHCKKCRHYEMVTL